MSVIEVKNLNFTYGKNTPFQKSALTNINLTVHKGEFIGIIGHTGSGKSTFIKHLNGLLKPTTGKIYFNGEDIWSSSVNIRDIRFKVGMVFQYPEHQLFADTVYKDIAFGPENMGLSSKVVKERVLSAAEFVGLGCDVLEKSPFEISGGEKRRVAIAGVIAMDPEVLILDEPTAGLDPKGKSEILQQIENYRQKKNNTIILVSHNMEEIANVASKVMVMSSGEMIMFDKTRKVFKNAHFLEKAGLKLPQITEIMQSLQKKGFNIRCDILTVKEAEEEIKRLVLERKE